MIILGNYKNNYDIATKTAQSALKPKQLNLVGIGIGMNPIGCICICKAYPFNTIM